MSAPKAHGDWLWVVVVSDAAVDAGAVVAGPGGAATLDEPQDATNAVSTTSPNRTTACRAIVASGPGAGGGAFGERS